MKKVLFILFALLPMMVSAYTGNAVINGIKYHILTPSLMAEVIKSDDTYSGDIIIPSTISYDGVTCKVKYITAKAFESSNITSVEIGDEIITIEDSAFTSCKSLLSIKIGKSVRSIKAGAFAGCQSLKEVVIPDDVTTVEPNAFNGCTDLVSVTIGKGVVNIDQTVFWNCQNMEYATIGCKTVPTLFMGKTKLAHVTLKNGVEKIDNHAFYKCSSLEAIKIPSTVKYIGVCAFYQTGLYSVFIPSSVETIRTKAFMNIETLKEIYLPSWRCFYDNSVAYSLFLNGCTNLRNIYIYTPSEISGYPAGSPNYTLEFDKKNIILHVPKADIEKYKESYAFKGFKEYLPLTAEDYVYLDLITPVTPVFYDNYSESSEIYSLSGQRVMNPKPGIYIQGGRKVVVK